MRLCNCNIDLEAMLCDIPEQWRDAIADALCFTFSISGQFTCIDLKKCQHKTVFQSFTLIGNVLTINYKDENGSITSSSIDISSALDDIADAVDPSCLMSQDDWNALSSAEQIQAIIDGYCACCGTTTTTTSSTTTTTTACCQPTASTVLDITTTTSTTTTTTTDPFDYYLANVISCDDCGTVDAVNVKVKFFHLTGVPLGHYFISQPFDGNTYLVHTPTTPGVAVDLSTSLHNTTCAGVCSGQTTTTTTTSTSTTTTTTAAPTTTTSTTTTTTIPHAVIPARFGVTIGVCGNPLTNVYAVPAHLSSGVAVFTDPGMSLPLLGRNFIQEEAIGIVYNLNPSTGIVGTNTGNSC